MSCITKRVPFVPLWRGSSVNGVIDTRYGALMPRLAVNLVGPIISMATTSCGKAPMPPTQPGLAGD
ncbi:MAG: hypothetical protein ACLRXB_08825 [Escherichia coli]